MHSLLGSMHHRNLTRLSLNLASLANLAIWLPGPTYHHRRATAFARSAGRIREKCTGDDTAGGEGVGEVRQLGEGLQGRPRKDGGNTGTASKSMINHAYREELCVFCG